MYFFSAADITKYQLLKFIAPEFIVGRGLLKLQFYEDPPPPILPTPFLKFRPNLLSPSPNPHAHCSFESGQFTEVWNMWFFTSTLIWYQRNTQRHTAHTGVNTLTKQYRYILTSPAIYIDTIPTALLTGIKFTHVVFSITLI